MGTPFHQHLLDVTPLLKKGELVVLNLLGIIRVCN
jgi:hypothetical protein